MTDLGGTTVATVTIEEDEGDFFYSLDGGASRVGPYETEVAATRAATALLETAYAEFVKAQLFGEQK